MITFFDLMRNIVNTLNTVVRSESQNLTEEEKTIVRDNIGVPSQNDFVIVQTTVANMKADMEYVPIEIIKIYNNIGTVEKGTEVKEMLVTWELNKDPEEQTLGGYKFKVPNDDRSSTVPMEGRTSVELVVTDERGATDSESTGYKAYNGVYYGVLSDGADINSAVILSLNKKIQNTKGVTFTADCTGGKRIAYAIPSTGYGAPTFQDVNTKLPIDMTQVPDPIQFTNVHGYTTEYKVWLSTNVLKQPFTVAVS